MTREATALTALAAADLLDRAADRVAPPGAWCQGSDALGEDGEVEPDDPRAVRWCAWGAIFADGSGAVPDLATVAVKQYLSVGTLADWNDDPARTKRQVISALRATARQLRKSRA